VTEDYEYTETLAPIDWTISDDTKLVCGHECRKATGRFRERTYEAWFTEDIPSSVGPWKLRGLPGAILFAEDTDGLCRFEAISVTYAPDIIEKTEYPYIKITRKEYATMLKQYFKTPGRFRSMHMSMAPGIKVIPAGKETPLRSIVILEKD
jgi:GLPGLI family protein